MRPLRRLSPNEFAVQYVRQSYPHIDTYVMNSVAALDKTELNCRDLRLFGKVHNPIYRVVAGGHYKKLL